MCCCKTGNGAGGSAPQASQTTTNIYGDSWGDVPPQPLPFTAPVTTASRTTTTQASLSFGAFEILILFVLFVLWRWLRDRGVI